MNAVPTIILLGGGFSDNEFIDLDNFLLRNCQSPKPKICFIPTASGDSSDYIARFYAALPPIKNLSQTDVPKDIAAMANSGGGMIVYGVKENQKVASSRLDTGEFSEGHEGAYRSVAVTAIVPPVFGIEIYRLGIDTRAVAVSVPASVDGHSAGDAVYVGLDHDREQRLVDPAAPLQQGREERPLAQLRDQSTR